MCDVWQRRQELDDYEAVVVGIASRIEGTSFYEYHKAFSARAAALIQQHNVKIDWAVRDNGMVCSLFVGQTANVCALCGSVAHSSNFCPMLVSGKSVESYRGPLPGRPKQTPMSMTSTDIQGRPRVSVGQKEVCNNFNSDRGCQRRDCKFLHSCLNRLARNSGTLGQPLASQLGHSRSGGTTSSYNSVMGFHLAIKLNTKIRNPTGNT